MTLWDKEKEDSNSESESSMLSNKEFSRNDIIVSACNGTIYALDKRNGARLWKTKIKSSVDVISVYISEDNKLIAGARGKTYGLKLMTGEIIWTNKMPEMGWSEVSVVTTPKKNLPPHLVSSSSEDPDLPPRYDQVREDKQIVISLTEGKAMAIDLDTGETMWTYECPGGWYNIPVAVVEPSNWDAGRPYQLVYIGAGRWVYCLNAKTGDVIWSSQTSTSLTGSDYCTLATSWNSRLAAESQFLFTQKT